MIARNIIGRLSLCFALGIGVSTPIAADPFSSEFSGRWLGRGILAPEIGGPDRKGRCKVEVLDQESPDELRMEGFCAIAAGRSELILQVIRVNETSLRAGFHAQGLDETAQYDGTYNDKQIKLRTKTVFFLKGSPFHSRIAIDFQDRNHFTLNDWVRGANGGPEHVAVSMNFERLVANE